MIRQKTRHLRNLQNERTCPAEPYKGAGTRVHAACCMLLADGEYREHDQAIYSFMLDVLAVRNLMLRGKDPITKQAIGVAFDLVMGKKQGLFIEFINRWKLHGPQRKSVIREWTGLVNHGFDEIIQMQDIIEALCRKDK